MQCFVYIDFVDNKWEDQRRKQVLENWCTLSLTPTPIPFLWLPHRPNSQRKNTVRNRLLAQSNMVPRRNYLLVKLLEKEQKTSYTSEHDKSHCPPLRKA